jgi:hypothetical protein
MAVASIGFSNMAGAADLYGEGYEPRDGAEYGRPYYSGEDKGYTHSDRYDYSDNHDEAYEEEPYGHRSYKDGEYLPPMSGPPRFAYEDWRARRGCVPRWQIRQSLFDDGWRYIRRLRLLPDTVVIRASRPSGRTYDLKLDRCTGVIIARRPTYVGALYGPESEYRRYGRTY